MQTDSPSTSSPYSPQTGYTSSPSPSHAEQKPTIQQLQAAGYTSNRDLSQAPYTQYGVAHHMSNSIHTLNSATSIPPPPPPFNFDLTVSLNSRGTDAASVKSETGTIPATGPQPGGSRSEPPRRKIEVDGLRVVDTPSQFLAQMSSMNRLLLQGDPQFITKQRVETAIRVIFDLLRLVPATPSDPPIDSQLKPLLLRDQDGNVLTSLERISTFKMLKLQAGTTTKVTPKKQSQAGPAPDETSLFLETAVYTSGQEPRRVYACKRCRMRELKRRQSKDAARKQGSNPLESVEEHKVEARSNPGNESFINGDNPDQYDPQKSGAIVEEPPWDPSKADWRHEIVLFNSAPEIPITDGSCVWLPFRVVCYGKCHGEKLGFRVKFTLRTHTGHVIASSITNPIRITDDHKTDAKSKPKLDAPKNRRTKQTASVASSRRVSPTPSDVSSVQSISEAGAVIQKQTPSVRGKPYDRPTSHSPLANALNAGFPNGMPQSLALPPNDIMSQGVFDQGGKGTVSPGVLRQPAFDFSQFNAGSGAPSVEHSAASSNVASPLSVSRPLENDTMLFGTDMSNLSPFASLHALEQQQARADAAPQTMLYGGQSSDVEIANAMSAGLDNLFEGSSYASSYDSASVFSGQFPEGSMFSESGLVPEEDDMQGFLDFTGGEGETDSHPLTQPTFYDPSISQSISPDPAVPQNQLQYIPPVPPPQPQPPANPAQISIVIPAEGPVTGGTRIAIIGSGFAPGIVILFGDRTAKLEKVDPTVIQCLSPPSADPGDVPVNIVGSMPAPGDKQHYFKYHLSEADLIRLAMQVSAGYNGQMNPAAFQLAQSFGVRSTSGSDWGAGRSSTSPINAGPTPRDVDGVVDGAATSLHADGHSSGSAAGDVSSGSTSGATAAQEKPGPDEDEDSQTKIINFIAAIDKNAPGSLRRSGCINMTNEAQQSLLHIATVLGYHRLVRRLVVVGADLDLQDVNGYTALSFASLFGQAKCARVLIEAGAAYDRPTAFGEMPLDLAKAKEHAEVEALLLSAVWSTEAQPAAGIMSDNLDVDDTLEDDEVASASALVQSPSEESTGESTDGIDGDNPSDDSDDEGHRPINHSPKLKHRSSRRLRSNGRHTTGNSPADSRKSSLELPAQSVPSPAEHSDDPPPYESDNPDSDPDGRLSTLPASIKLPVPDAVWNRLPMPIHEFVGEQNHEDGWVAFPALSWETLHKMTSPDEVKMFTQAVAAAAFNAVVQSGATTSTTLVQPAEYTKRSKAKTTPQRRKSRSSREGSQSGSPHRKVAAQVRGDRMLYMFWLPILLFVGFWLFVTAVPIATGICFIYARQISRALKQR